MQERKGKEEKEGSIGERGEGEEMRKRVAGEKRVKNRKGRRDGKEERRGQVRR